MKEQRETKAKRRDENREGLRVNVHNDAEMVGFKLRVRPRVPRDPSVWTNTIKEKAELDTVIGTGMVSTNWSAPLYSSNFPGKLIVYLKKLPRVEKKGKDLINQFHSTMSHSCNQSDIATILARYCESNLEIVKYAWNGRTYSANTLPVRLGRGGRVSA